MWASGVKASADTSSVFDIRMEERKRKKEDGRQKGKKLGALLGVSGAWMVFGGACVCIVWARGRSILGVAPRMSIKVLLGCMCWGRGHLFVFAHLQV